MWYAAKLLFESNRPDDEGRILQEESIRLIQAGDEAEANSKASSLGIAEQHHYSNCDGEDVAWQFVSVLEIQDLSEASVSDGMEVFATMKWKSLASISLASRATDETRTQHG